MLVRLKLLTVKHSALVFSHALVILGPTLLKIGYVMRLSALFRMRRPGWEVCCASA